MNVDYLKNIICPVLVKDGWTNAGDAAYIGSLAEGRLFFLGLHLVS